MLHSIRATWRELVADAWCVAAILAAVTPGVPDEVVEAVNRRFIAAEEKTLS
jgi:hypothetical protein